MIESVPFDFKFSFSYNISYEVLLASCLTSTFGFLCSLQIRVIRTYRLPSDIAAE